MLSISVLNCIFSLHCGFYLNIKYLFFHFLCLLQKLQDHLARFSGQYDQLVAFKPTGWTFSQQVDSVGDIQPEISGAISIYGTHLFLSDSTEKHQKLSESIEYNTNFIILLSYNILQEQHFSPVVLNLQLPLLANRGGKKEGDWVWG